MKNKLLLLLCSIQLFTSCSKTGGGGGTPTPTPTGSSKGYIRVTFSGKTLEARDTILMKGTPTELFYPMGASISINSVGGLFSKTITVMSNTSGGAYENGTLRITVVGNIDSSKTNSALEMYKTWYWSSSTMQVKDLTTSTIYPIDTPSTVTVTYSDAAYTEGTMKLTLQGSGGSKIPATGSFKIYHK